MEGIDYRQVYNPVLDGRGYVLREHRHDLYWEVSGRTNLKLVWKWWWFSRYESETLYEIGIDNCRSRSVEVRRDKDVVDTTRVRSIEELAESPVLKVACEVGDHIVLIDGWHFAGLWAIDTSGLLIPLDVPADVKWRQGPPRLYARAL